MKSSLQRWPSLPALIGPVKGVSYATARRLVLNLRTGFAVPNYGALEYCPVIWVIVPEARLDMVVRELAAQVPLHKNMVVICDSPRESCSLEALRLRGARVATLNAVDDSRQAAFVAEGHGDAMRFLRRIADQDQRKLVELRTGTKAGYFAGVHLMTDLLRVLVTSAINCFQLAGIPRPDGVDIATSLATRSVKAHARTGAKGWSRAELGALRQALEERAVELQRISPIEGPAYARAIELALEYFESHAAPKKARSHHA